MNWKNVVLLMKVNHKSSRMVRGKRFRRFRESRKVSYFLYVLACALGASIGWLLGGFYAGTSDPSLRQVYFSSATDLLTTLPTFALLYGFVFTQMNQVQRVGVKASIQPLYWFPFTWSEHTLASVLANIAGTPLLITTFVCSCALLASLSLDLVPLAVLAVLALLVSLLLASATTEALRTLQVRMFGAITKATGRAGAWVRFAGTILLFIVFYAIYFVIYSRVASFSLFGSVASWQRVLWFIPYLWPGLTLSAFASGLAMETALLSLASIGFVCFCLFLAVRLNAKFGLYEVPAIRVSAGAYVPKAGFLAKMGFSSVEAAMVKKDFRAFTRRGETMYIFIFPIMLAVMPIFSSVGGGSNAPPPFFLFVYLTWVPGAVVAALLGNVVVGSEGESVWFIHSSPVSSTNLIKAKYSLVVLFGAAVALICSLVSGLVTAPSIWVASVTVVEGLLLILSIGMVSLAFGTRGADFRVSPLRPIMIRPLWAFVSLVACFIAGASVVASLIPFYVGPVFQIPGISLSVPAFYSYLALPISAGVALAIAYVFHKMATSNADELLLRREE